MFFLALRGVNPRTKRLEGVHVPLALKTTLQLRKKEALQCSTHRAKYAMKIFYSWISQTRTTDDLQSELVVLICRAIELTRVIRCQRACWTLRFDCYQDFQQKELLFHDRIMEDIEDNDQPGSAGRSPRKRIDIIITPAIYKSEIADGEMYNVETVMEKALVKCV